jgi:hypothetical protein
MLKVQKFLTVGYVAFLLFGFLYVHSVLARSSSSVDSAEKAKPTKQVKAHINITVYNSDGTSTVYNDIKLVGNNVRGVLEDLATDQKVPLEITMYTYGDRVTMIDNIRPQTGYEWALTHNGKAVNDFDNVFIANHDELALRLAPTSSTQ